MCRTWNQRLSMFMISVLLSELFFAPFAGANPVNPNVVAGQAAISGLGTSHVTVQQASQRAIINWQQFNIAPNEVTQFVQPNANAIALNRIFDQNPSQIFGKLQANGQVILMNQNGIIFGPNAQVNAAGFVASSLHMSDANFLRGHYLFEGGGLEGMVKNAGAIHAPNGIYLLAPNVENSGVLTSPGGNVVLGAGKTAYLSNRPDGRGFLAEITAPVGQAVNLKQIVADGGQVTLAGRVVNQAGLIQANTVRERNGKIELLASEAVTLRDGSRTIARGDMAGVSQGGTIEAIADLKTGTASFEKGAVVDVSGGKLGGDGGFAEVSAASVKLGGQFLGNTATGFRGGRFLIDPTVATSTVGPGEFVSFENSGAFEVEFRSPAGTDLTVTGSYDLKAWQSPAVTSRTLTFTAGKDLKFVNATLINSGTAKWDYIGIAQQGDVLLTNSTIATGANYIGSSTPGAGGNISLFAPNGSIKLIDSLGGSLSTVRTPSTGGDITLIAKNDIVSASALDQTGKFLKGIRLEGPGNLTIDAEKNFIGGRVSGFVTGPGFVLTNGVANVTTGGNIGGAIKGIGNSDADEYANFTLASGTINLSAGENIYLGRIQDKGLSDIRDVSVLIGWPGHPDQRLTYDPSNQVNLVAKGDIFLNPRAVPIPGTSGSNRDQARATYPASFSANSETGRIVVENSVTFWPSPTGKITLSAQKDIVGLATTIREPDYSNYVFIFIGTEAQVQQGSWKLVPIVDANTKAEYAPYRKWIAPSQRQDDRPFPTLPSIPSDIMKQVPFIETTSRIPQIRIMETDPAVLIDALYATPSRPFDAQFGAILSKTLDTVSPIAPVPVTVESRTGSIKTLAFDFTSYGLPKQVTISAKQDIAQINAEIGVPQGIQAVVSAGHNMDFRKPNGFQDNTGITFIGTGTGRVQVKNDLNEPGAGKLDLADSIGIQSRSAPFRVGLGHNKGGLVDIAVAGDLIMDQSRVISHNGATISIHGIGTETVTDTKAGTLDPISGKPFAIIKNLKGELVSTEVLFDGNPISLDNATLLAGPTTLHVSLVERNGSLFVNNGERVQVVRVEGQPLVVDKIINGTPTSVLILAGGGQTFLARTADVSMVTASGGKVVVGNNIPSPLGDTGILTLRGGAIDIKASGDIDVDKSRIATFGGRDLQNLLYRAGDINLVSTNGNISAGSGSRNDVVKFVVLEKNADNTVNPDRSFVADVPGSGVFSYHADDQKPGDKLVFPRFDDPQIRALGNEIFKQEFLGRDASALRTEQANLLAQREPVFLQTVERFIRPLQLGNISMYAAKKDVIVPEAGIRGRRIGIFSPNGIIDLQGGIIEGSVTIASTAIKGDIGKSFVGALTATTSAGGVSGGVGSGSSGGSLGGLTGTTGSVSAAATSTTAAASSSAIKATDDVKEAASEIGSAQAEAKAKQVVAKAGDKDKDSRKVAQTIKAKHGVIIQVEAKPRTGG
ncbi:hypothetical protein W02_20560 [Nitrospira sp. KM1]|uniref:two-partner secretion domain-containing protein n=1 Tax=Nitrospira sp. KM1 TaxID=1936990 RepID=UPI0013A754C2|nr:filamentous hemagglutinin N-terminal domain-containing protein [Nitrospira sp. KM1]BCA54916.1 hypothetical protein W02_20560 [Nitrospira sp. KM1]